MSVSGLGGTVVSSDVALKGNPAGSSVSPPRAGFSVSDANGVVYRHMCETDWGGFVLIAGPAFANRLKHGRPSWSLTHWLFRPNPRPPTPSGALSQPVEPTWACSQPFTCAVPLQASL